MPGDKDESLVFQEFLEFQAADEIVIVLTPLGAPVGMIERGSLDFGIIVCEVDDQLIGAGRKGLQHFFVGIEPQRLGNAWNNLDDGVEENGVGVDGEFIETRVADEESGQMVSAGSGEIDLEEIVGRDDGAHVRVEMREVNAGGGGFIDLGVRFGFDIGHLGVGDDVLGKEGKVTIGVEKAGAFGLR